MTGTKQEKITELERGIRGLQKYLAGRPKSAETVRIRARIKGMKGTLDILKGKRVLDPEEEIMDEADTAAEYAENMYGRCANPPAELPAIEGEAIDEGIPKKLVKAKKHFGMPVVSVQLQSGEARMVYRGRGAETGHYYLSPIREFGTVSVFTPVPASRVKAVKGKDYPGYSANPALIANYEYILQDTQSGLFVSGKDLREVIASPEEHLTPLPKEAAIFNGAYLIKKKGWEPRFMAIWIEGYRGNPLDPAEFHQAIAMAEDHIGHGRTLMKTDPHAAEERIYQAIGLLSSLPKFAGGALSTSKQKRDILANTLAEAWQLIGRADMTQGRPMPNPNYGFAKRHYELIAHILNNTAEAYLDDASSAWPSTRWVLESLANRFATEFTIDNRRFNVNKFLDAMPWLSPGKKEMILRQLRR